MAAAALLVLSTVLAGVPDDAGEVARYALTYQAPPGCPDETQVRTDLDTHIHDRARARGVRLAIVLQRSGRETAGEMTLDDRAGERQRRALRGRDCAEVAHALAFLAALAIDLGAAPEEAAPPAATAPAPPPVLVAPPPAPAPPPVPHRFAPTIRMAAELRGGLGDTSRPAALAGFSVEDRRPRWFAPAAGVAILGGGGRTTGLRGSADLWLLGGQLSLCPLRALLARVELRPCAVGEAGAITARAASLINPPSLWRPWLSIDATLSLRWPQGSRIFAELEAGVIFPLIRPTYTFLFEPDQPLYAVPAVTARAGVGVGYRF
jgi:hypothetical protein